jgi:hypothetical protein
MKRLALAVVGLAAFSATSAVASRMPQVQATAAAQARAHALTLARRDFPTGWKPDPVAVKTQPFDLFGTPCRSVEPDLSSATIVGWSSSQYERFGASGVQLAQHGVFVFATEAQARTMYTRWALTWATRCMKVGRTDGNARIVSAQPFQPAAAGVSARGFRYLSMQKSPASRLVYVDAILFRSRSAYSMLFLVRTDKPFDHALETALVGAIAKRLTR